MKKICKYINRICMVLLLTFTMMPVVNAEEDINNDKPSIEDLTFAGSAEFWGTTNTNGETIEAYEIGLDEFMMDRLSNQYLFYKDNKLAEDEQSILDLYYHVNYKNLSPDIIEFEIDQESTTEATDRKVKINGLKEGKASIKCVITDIENPEIMRQETIELSVINKANKIDIVFFGGEYNDFSNEKKLDTKYIYSVALYPITIGTARGYYHTTFENLSPDMIEISSDIEGVWENANIIESVDSGDTMHNGIKVKALKAGDAKIRCTLYDIKHPERTKTEVIDLTFKEQETTNSSDATITPEKPKHEVSYTGSKDILKNDDTLTETINMIQNAEGPATINLTMKENVDIITLPKDILQAAKEKNIPLMVNVNMNGRTITWTFSTIDQIMDINLAMNVINTKDWKH